MPGMTTELDFEPFFRFQRTARQFYGLHIQPEPLVLANVWDAASARLVEAAGSPAVATTSAGVAWGLGAADGDRLDRDAAIALIKRVVAAVDVPVTADIESGFGATAEDVADTVALVLKAGAVGINIEDGLSSPSAARRLRPAAEQAERIAAARAVAESIAIPMYINARIDVFLFGVGQESGRLAETLRRAELYLEAGASGVFVPGVADPKLIGELVEGIEDPLNVLAGPGSPLVAQLRDLGVRRVSLGSGVAGAAYAAVDRAARELLTLGTYGALEGALDYGTINSLMSEKG